MRSLIGNLPTDSETILAVHPHLRWTQEHELLALAVEYTQQIGRFVHAAWLKAPHPEQVVLPRPNDEGGEKKTRMSSAAEVKRFFGGAVKVFVREGVDEPS